MYRWNKSRFLLERSFRNLVVKCHRRMSNESGNSTEDSSEGGLGRCESSSPSNALGRDAGGNDCDRNDEEDTKGDPEAETDGTKT